MSIMPLPGTPPFAPAEPIHTGGTDMAPRQRGLAGFLDRVLNPTNALGQFGQALVAGGGSPATAIAYLMQQRAAAAKPQQEFDAFKQRYDYETAHPHQQADDVFTRTLAAAGIDPVSEEGRALYRNRAATLASPAPQMVGDADHGYNWVTPPPPALPGAMGMAPQADAPVIEDGYQYTPGPGGKANKANWTPVGGAGSNAGGNFRGL